MCKNSRHLILKQSINLGWKKEIEAVVHPLCMWSDHMPVLSSGCRILFFGGVWSTWMLTWWAWDSARRGTTSGHVMRCFQIVLKRAGKTHPDWRWYHFIGWSPRLSKEESPGRAAAFVSLWLLGCRSQPPHLMLLLLPWLPHSDRLRPQTTSHLNSPFTQLLLS